MKIMIDIDKEQYETVCFIARRAQHWRDKLTLEQIIATGEPLKGYGRLIDAEKLINSTDKEYIHKYEIALAPTVIKADKSERRE